MMSSRIEKISTAVALVTVLGGILLGVFAPAFVLAIGIAWLGRVISADLTGEDLQTPQRADFLKRMDEWDEEVATGVYATRNYLPAYRTAPNMPVTPHFRLHGSDF